MVVVVVFEFSNVVGQGLDPCEPVCYGLLKGRLWEGQLVPMQGTLITEGQ